MIPEIIMYLFLCEKYFYFLKMLTIPTTYRYLYSILNIKKSFQAGTEYKLMFTKEIYKEAILIYLNIFVAVIMSKTFKKSPFYLQVSIYTSVKNNTYV